MSGIRNTLRDLFSGGGLGSANLVLAIVIALLVGLVVAVVVYVLYTSSTRGKIRSAASQRATARRGTTIGLQVLAVALLGLLIFATTQYLERPSTCAQCHVGTAYADSVEQSPHSGAECADCHTATGLTAPAQNMATYVRWVATYAAERKEPEVQAGSVGNGPCLECHEDVTEGSAVRGGIRVRHSDFLAEGWACRECHNSTGHPNVVLEPSTPTMEKCLPCHDGERAPSACETCHTQEVGTPSYQDTELPEVALKTQDSKESCYQCHVAQTECTFCHGVQMPHPENWVAGGQQGNHARQAFANRELCWRCHYSGQALNPDYGFCAPCHNLNDTPHGDTKTWVREHGPQATGQVPGAEYGMCFACHSATLCDNCHPPEYGRDLYNPVGAPFPE